jgi:DNA-binding beta-propeller fold protein YncE
MVAVSCLTSHTLRLYKLAPDFPLLDVLGGPGAGTCQFASPLWVCFTPWGDHTLLVPEEGNHRVQEVNIVTKSFVKMWGTEGEHRVTGPRGVAASRQWVAVTQGQGPAGALTLLSVPDNVATRRLDRDPGLRTPDGVRFSRDGHFVIVADLHHVSDPPGHAGRLCFIDIRSGAVVDLLHTSTTPSAWGNPSDVEEVEDGYVVVNHARQQVTKVFVDPSRAPVDMLASTPGHLATPVAIAAYPGVGFIVLHQHGGGQLQLLPSCPPRVLP